MTTLAAPTGVTAVPGLASVVLTWTAPSGTVTGYNVYQSTTSGAEYNTCQSISTTYLNCSVVASHFATCANLISTRINGGGAPVTYTATGLTNGTQYYFVVVAYNSSGPSAPSAEVTAIPGYPTRPLSVTATPGNAQATVSWKPPTFTGGDPITGYTVTSFPGAITQSAGASASSAVVTGLTNGRSYYFTVEATTAIGTGPMSMGSNTVVPEGVPQPPTVSAVGGADALSGDPIITLTVVANTTVTPTGYTMAATLQRNDGTYVIGASPTNPLPVSLTTNTATIEDFTAPYGLVSTYIATIIFSSAAPPVISPPSVPSNPVTMGLAPDTNELYSRMGWAKDEDVTGTLNLWLAGIGNMIQTLDTMCRDGYDIDGNPAPGWSQVLDINRAPTAALPWLAQFVGVRFDSSIRDDMQRYLIMNPPGFARGSPGALIAAANAYLQPGYSITLTERDTSPYHLAISVPTAGIIGSSTCLSIKETYATCSSLIAAFATCSAMFTTDSNITAAINASIPAGLVVALTFV